MVEPDDSDAADAGSHPLWFTPPVVDQDRRRALTRERVVAEALSVIGADGVDALSMRALATRLGVVPGGAVPPRTQQGAALRPRPGRRAGRGRLTISITPSPGPSRSRSSRTGCGRSWTTIPASPGCLRPATPSDRTPSPWPRPSSHRCTRPASPSGRPAWPSPCSTTTPSASPSAAPPRVNEQRRPGRRDQEQTPHVPPVAAARPLPRPGRPRRAHVWVDNRDERFTAGLDTLIDGLQAQRRRRQRSHQPKR